MKNEVIFLFISCYIADLIFGDPEWFPHPVRGIGKIINILDNWLRGKQSNKLRERIKGAILVIFVIGICGCFAYLILEIAKRLNNYLWYFIWVYLGYTTLAIKDLHVKSKAILNELKNNDIKEARNELSKIVGRDTEEMEEEEIITATVESIAENTNDGIVAPLFYLIIGGPVLAIIYKAINTLDSMVGYKNEKYIYFGWASAKLDDIANYIPARISGFLISIASLILGYGFLNSFKTMLKYGRCHPSPNSGILEAAISGALGVRLGGPSFYQGIEVRKPYIGEDKNEVNLYCINSALNISFITSLLMLFIGVVLKWII
jgi:adenosylcobinamide-phosphate synthase